MLGWTDDNDDLAHSVQVRRLSSAPHSVCNVVTFRPLEADRAEMTVTQYDWAMGHLIEVPEMAIAEGLERMAASLEPAFAKDRILVGAATNSP
jgi:hypothetical protein